VVQPFSWIRAVQKCVQLLKCKRGFLQLVTSVSNGENGVVWNCWYRGSDASPWELQGGGSHSRGEDMLWIKHDTENRLFWTRCCSVELGDSHNSDSISYQKKKLTALYLNTSISSLEYPVENFSFPITSLFLSMQDTGRCYKFLKYFYLYASVLDSGISPLTFCSLFCEKPQILVFYWHILGVSLSDLSLKMWLQNANVVETISSTWKPT